MVLELDDCTGVGIDGGQDAIGGRSNDRTTHNLHILILELDDSAGLGIDGLWLDGDLRDLPLSERKRVLRRIIPRRGPCLQFLPHVHRRAVDLFTEVVRRDLEGMVAKLRQAPYDLVGGMSPWVKWRRRGGRVGHSSSRSP